MFINLKPFLAHEHDMIFEALLFTDEAPCHFHLEEKVSCEPLIQSEIDSSVPPISALFSW